MSALFYTKKLAGYTAFYIVQNNCNIAHEGIKYSFTVFIPRNKQCKEKRNVNDT